MIRRTVLAHRPCSGSSAPMGTAWPLLIRSVTDGGSIDRCDPDGLPLVAMDDALRTEFVGFALIVSIIHVEGDDQSLVQFDALTHQVFLRAGAGQSQPVG